MGFITYGKTLLLLSATIFFEIIFAQNRSNDKILARIGEKEISVKEFIERSELTIRPNNFKSKNTTLNNLISEKILALEAKRNNTLLSIPLIEGRLRGIKEQLMRDKLYDEASVKKVKLDSQEVKNTYRLSVREYELEFYTLQSPELAHNIQTAIELAPELTDDLLKQLEEAVGKKPIQRIKYKDPEDDIIHESLYSKPLDVGTVVGPLRLRTGEYIIMKVLNWTATPLVAEEDQQMRWVNVQEKLREIKARKMWALFQKEIMKGKKIEFTRDSFKVLSDMAIKFYIRNNSGDSGEFKIPTSTVAIDSNAVFFTIDKTEWTIGRFGKELMAHPLVFRTTNLDSSKFKEQFKLAIVDMVRDYYLNVEAYKRSYDKSADVNNALRVWRDAFLALDTQMTVLKAAMDSGKFTKDDIPATQKYWVSYVRSLQDRYSDKIRINFKEFDRITLTNVDMFAYRTGVPYPVAVPGFPLFISSENLESMTPLQRFYWNESFFEKTPRQNIP
jgi:hypothetical protein